ncbi:A/G-specific adenine DNA glycosylase [Podospora aff. communis PSN243]|uniref:Adenine DNA glycosylase n=1 Tax=Podospora aff. communis PSN243 TaxID=3040156 RepID=A0AAV9GIT7_9PEZI|nr:A/G-specific adenine DNA glycosylase [Podospora aff. communis PSN243]
MMRRSQRAAASRAASNLRQQTTASPDPGSDAGSSPEPTPAPSSSEDDEPSPPPTKRRKFAPTKSRSSKPNPNTTAPIANPNPDFKPKPLTLLPPPPNPLPPSRIHPPSYHHPLLLSVPQSRTALLSWFTTVHSSRLMPWRKPFLQPSSTPHHLLAKRAYEVWISEVMLQQTRVATVVAYWNRWMDKWPTIEDLAAAKEEEVLSLWQGLGYYSRAKRVHEAARVVVGEMGGLLPAEVGELVARVPGVGRYTAGAIAAIVFGRAEAMVDGNVVRVLCRQLGVFGDGKGREVVEGIWEVAAELARVVARDGVEDGQETPVSEVPGRWGQALMELGSTVCTPKPNCRACPVTETCRAYQEGLALARGEKGGRVLQDVEDICGVCHPWAECEEVSDEDDEAAPKRKKARLAGKKSTVSAYFTAPSKSDSSPGATRAPSDREMEIIVPHARKFPLRKPKKKVREEEIVVCGIRRRSDGKYLIHQRPEKGLLANMWELPSHTLPKTTENLCKAREAASTEYVAELLSKGKKGSGDRKRKTTQTAALDKLRCGGEMATVTWLFSHLKHTMYVHMFEDLSTGQESSAHRSKWASIEEIEEVSMGTGMRNCWEVAKSVGTSWTTSSRHRERRE